MSYSCLAVENNWQISLNGNWQFTNQNFIDENTLLSSDFTLWDSLMVPGNWDTTEKYKTYSGKAYYQKSFNLPEQWRDKNIRLKFNAVYQSAKVWLNGQLLGQHVGGYTPFEFNLTPYINFTKTNSLVVMADNSYQRGAWWAWGGISRDVSLSADNDVRLVYQHITAIPDFDQQIINYQIKYKLQNYSNKKQTVNITSSVQDNEQHKKQFSNTITLEGKSTGFKQIKFVDDLKNYHLWQLDNPYLYKLNSQISTQQQTIDHKVDNFGIRKFEIRGEQFYFNNQAMRLNGLNRVHDHPDHGNTEPKALVIRDMQDIKSLGGNFSRLMHAPLSKSLLDACDRLGYLVIGEIPVWGDDDPQSFPDNPLTKQWLKEMIERDFNHPAIVGWSVGNELRDPLPPWSEKTLTPSQLGYINSMLDYVAKLDPNRLKTYVSLTAFNASTNKSNEPYDKLDFISINSYGNATQKVTATHQNFPGKPIFLSEVGIKQIGGGAGASLNEELVAELKQLKNYPYLIGFSLWAYNDYRSNYKGTPKSGYREWGIVNQYREKKAAYYQLKDIFNFWLTPAIKE
ncbi:glycoside hydrolase family 2 protein [Thalassotalea agariperforans]